MTDQGIVYVPSKGTTALRPTTSGEPEVVWNDATLQPGAASMIVDGGRLLAINRAGVLVCADAADGHVLWRVRLQGEFWGTPVLAGNKLYCDQPERRGAGRGNQRRRKPRRAGGQGTARRRVSKLAGHCRWSTLCAQRQTPVEDRGPLMAPTPP